ncbi:hypothetical protein ACOMHN_043050 [Nucella lapillus]
MTCPGTYPTVLNGKSSSSNNTTVEFECSSGFFMSGNKRISCFAGVWEATPICTVIRQYDEVSADVFPDWWFYVLAAILGLMVLACFLCIILRFCCGGCYCCDNRKAVSPSRHQRSEVMRVEEEVGEDAAHVYYVPVHSTTPMQGRQLFKSTKSTKTRSVSTDTNDMKKTRHKNTATNTADSYHTSYLDPGRRVSYVYGYDGSNPVSNGTPRLYESYVWSENKGARASHHQKGWKESANYEVVDAGLL